MIKLTGEFSYSIIFISFEVFGIIRLCRMKPEMEDAPENSSVSAEGARPKGRISQANRRGHIFTCVFFLNFRSSYFLAAFFIMYML